MPKDERGLTRIELLQGTLDLIILQTLRWGPRHGYGLAQMIRANSREALRVDTGSLYPALHRLEKSGAVRRYTRTRWEQLSEAIAGILAPPLPESDT